MKMNEFCINANKIRNGAENLSTIDSELKKCIDSLRGINENLQFSGDELAYIQKDVQHPIRMFYINHEDIDEILFMGFESELEEIFVNTMLKAAIDE